MAATLGELSGLIGEELRTKEDREAVLDIATRYAHALLLHIDAENSVLLPEGEERLRRAGIHELEGRAATAEELAARAEGERLAEIYPPVHDPAALRGEGCVICPSYGTTCGGLEREWWTDDEWEEFESREG
jgi:hypothetical protein